MKNQFVRYSQLEKVAKYRPKEYLDDYSNCAIKKDGDKWYYDISSECYKSMVEKYSIKRILILSSVDKQLIQKSEDRKDKKKWPLRARAVAKLASKEDKGVGDTIARVLKRFKLDSMATAYTWITGVKCGCSDRQTKLNNAFPYSS